MRGSPGAGPRWSWVEVQALGPDLATGLRAALATVIPLVLSVQLARPELGVMAFGGWLATLTDPGGSWRRRGKVLLAFITLGSLVVWIGQTVASSIALAIGTFAAIAGPASLLRALGPAAGGLGTTLAIVAALTTALPSPEAGRHALWFAGGGGIAVLLSSILWPVWTHLPVRRSVARIFDELAAYAAAIGTAATGAGAGEVSWTELALQHPRRVREAIEQARAISLAVHARRFGESPMGSDLRLLLGLGEAQFLVLVTLAAELERLASPPPRTLESLDDARRRDAEVRAILVAPSVPSPRVERATTPAAPEPDGLTRLLAQLERDSLEALELAGGLGTGSPSPSVRESAPVTGSRLTSPSLRDALSPRSPIFRHAVRVTVASAAAAAAAAWLEPHHAAWVSITTIAVLQPYTGTTVKLAAERVVGTILGCLVVVAVDALTRSRLALALLMFPMSMGAVVTRPRSYRLFTFFVTPVFVLIALRSPGDWSTAVARVGDVLLGGAIAVGAALGVYPRWEERFGLPAALAAMTEAVEAYREVVLSAPHLRSPQEAMRIVEARRAAGIAVSEAETSLERRLAEPMRRGPDEEQALEQITLARRLVLAVTALDTLIIHSGAAAPPAQALERVRTFSELLRAAVAGSPTALAAVLQGRPNPRGA
jgi:uncharacterized membrane protein YccC